MRAFLILSAVTCLLCVGVITTLSAAPDLEPTRVAVQGDTIFFIVNNTEVGRFDKNGLHVVGDIEYTGTMTDTPMAKGDGHDDE